MPRPANLNPVKRPRSRQLPRTRPRKYNPGPHAGKSLFVEYRGESRFVVIVRAAILKGQARPYPFPFIVAAVQHDGTIGRMMEDPVCLTQEQLREAVPFGTGEYHKL